MRFDIHTLIGEATAYDKKQQIDDDSAVSVPSVAV